MARFYLHMKDDPQMYNHHHIHMQDLQEQVWNGMLWLNMQDEPPPLHQMHYHHIHGQFTRSRWKIILTLHGRYPTHTSSYSWDKFVRSSVKRDARLPHLMHHYRIHWPNFTKQWILIITFLHAIIGWWTMGCPANGKRGFAKLSESGRNRVPRKPNFQW